MVTNSGSPDSAALLTEKQKEIDGLKRTVSQLTDAYKELREIHEKLYKKHKSFLVRGKVQIYSVSSISIYLSIYPIFLFSS